MASNLTMMTHHDVIIMTHSQLSLKGLLKDLAMSDESSLMSQQK